MFFEVVIIIIGCIIGVFIIRSIINNSQYKEDNEAIIDEVIYYIGSLKKMYNGAGTCHMSKEKFCKLIIKPVNNNGKYFASDSEKLELSVSLYDDDFFDYSFNLQYLELVADTNNSPFFTCFHKGILMDGKKGFVALTNQSFKGSYKKFSNDLYDKINERFPNRFKILNNGGAILSTNDYPDEIFNISD